jgi:four helix bundle protein
METNFHNLKVWQKWIDLVEDIYKYTATFPNQEIYWITQQIRRSAISIPSNIAEWDQRSTKSDNIRFIYMAKWSAAELETQLIISNKLWYLSKKDFDYLQGKVVEILKMISSLIKFKKD